MQGVGPLSTLPQKNQRRISLSILLLTALSIILRRIRSLLMELQVIRRKVIHRRKCGTEILQLSR